MTKTKYKATVFDGHSHIERRVYTDSEGTRFIRINGIFFAVQELKNFDIEIWHE